MAYGLLLYKEIETPLGSQRVEIYKDGYSGTAVEIAGLHADGITISKDSQSLTQPITTSVLTLRLSDCNEVDYSQFFTPNATLFKVVWQTINGATTTTRWTGFITPDSYSENLAYRDTLTLTARDNLGRLNDYDFDLAQWQMLSVRAILTAAMTKAGVAMGLTFTTTKVATSPATVLAVDGLVNTTLLHGMTWHAAVELLLTGLGLTLAWNDGNAFEVRDITQAPANTQSAFFINKSGFRQIRPAWKNITLAQDYGLRSNFYEGQFTKDQCGDQSTFTIPSSSPWNYLGTIPLLNPYKGAAYPYETIYLPIRGGDTTPNQIAYTFPFPANIAPIKITFTANNTAWIYDNGIAERTTLATRKMSNDTYVPTPYAIRFRCNIFCVVGGTTYILRQTWQEYNPSTLEEPYLFFMMPPALTERYLLGEVDADNEVSIYLGTPPGAGLVSVVFYEPNVCGRDVIASRSDEPATYALAQLGSSWVTPYAKITNLTMSVDDGIGGRQMRVAVNPDHNMKGDLSVSLGQVPTGRGNTLLYLGGLFYNDTYYTPLTAFAKAQNGTNYDLLELVGREYITYQNAAYNALSGTMKANSAFRFDKGITFDGNAYRIVGASLAILSNTLSAQVLQQEASFDTAAYTVEAVDEEGNARAATTTGSIAQGAGFESEILRHLSLLVLNEGQSDEETIMVCDITFASEKNIIAGGVGSGGSTPGGGGSIATLADVTLTNLAGGDILKYNATSSHWENTPLVLSALADVSLGTPGNGQALVYSSTLGKWVPGTVASGATVVSSDATIGTSLTTLATVDGTAIKAKIASYLLASDFSAANIVSTLGNTAVNRAAADESGNNIKSTYAVGLYVSQNKLYLKSKSNELLSGYVDGSDIVSVIGNNAVARATADASGNTIASQTWVGNQGFLTSSDLSGYATQTWVGQQGYVTSSDLSGYATQTWVGNNYWSYSEADERFAHALQVSGTSLLLKSAASSSNTLSTITGSDLVTVIANNAVARATGDESGNNIKSTYAAGLYVYQNNLYLKSKSNELLTAYVDGSDLVTVIGTNAVARATADASGNAFSTSYLRKDIDDTMSGNLTIGTSSAKKTLTIRGTTGEALIIYGNSYYTELYCNASGLHISNDAKVYGNFVATGNVTAGSASDRRLKKNIRSITLAEAADLLMVLNPVVFEWNDKAGELGQLSGVSRGFLADEYLDLIPNAGRKIWGIYDAIDYVQTIPYLVAGWQQQNLRIRELESEIEDMRRRLREHGIQ